MFHVGQRVVCINDANPRLFPFMGVSRGCVYTIRGIDDGSGELGLFLEEVKLPVPSGRKTEASFDATRFRPVKETDISIFTAMLNPTPTKQKERA